MSTLPSGCAMMCTAPRQPGCSASTPRAQLAHHAVDQRLRLVGAREQQDVEQVLLGKVAQFRHARRAARVENLESGAAEQAVPSTLRTAICGTSSLKPRPPSAASSASRNSALPPPVPGLPWWPSCCVVEVVVAAHAVDKKARWCGVARAGRHRRRRRDAGGAGSAPRAPARSAAMRVDHVAPGVGRSATQRAKDVRLERPRDFGGDFLCVGHRRVHFTFTPDGAERSETTARSWEERDDELRGDPLSRPRPDGFCPSWHLGGFWPWFRSPVSDTQRALPRADGRRVCPTPESKASKTRSKLK